MDSLRDSLWHAVHIWTAEKRFGWHLFWVVVFFGIGSYVFIVQMYHLPVLGHGDIMRLMVGDRFGYDILTAPDWYVIDLYNSHYTLIEGFFSWSFFYFGIISLMDVIHDVLVLDDLEKWADFWGMCER